MTKQLMPVRVRGTIYPSAAHVARYFNIRRSAVYRAVSAGKADSIGLGPTNTQGRKFHFRDQNWPSYAAASRALGMNRCYVGQAMNGTPHERELLFAHLDKAFPEGAK
jgi:hypothetical protein